MNKITLAKYTLALAALVIGAEYTQAQNIGLRYSGKSWDCIPVSGNDCFILPFFNSEPIRSGPCGVMWKNHPVVCQAIPTRTLAGPRSGNDLKSILEKYGQQESAYQEKQGATCTPFEIIDIEGNKVGTMTMSSIFNGPQGSINIKIYTTWTVVGGTLLITTIQAPIQESHNYDFKAAKKYLYDSYKQFKKFSSRSEFERFLKPL